MAPRAPGDGERLTPRKRRRVGSEGEKSDSSALINVPNWSLASSGPSESDWSPESASSASEDEENEKVEWKIKAEKKEKAAVELFKSEQAASDETLMEVEPIVNHTAEFFCSLCGREFSFKHALVRHLKRRHKSDERLFECEQCRLAFRTKNELYKHEKDHIKVEGVTHACRACKQPFLTRHERHEHFRKAHFFGCPFKTCGDRFREKMAWTKHIRRYHKAVNGIQFACSQCGQEFPTRHALECHRQQQGHSVFVCSFPGCSKSYSKREHLTRHVSAAHSSMKEEKPFNCDLCQARFAYKHGLVRHMNRSHLNSDRPYTCSVCQLAFKKKSLLQAHSFVHTGTLPFECEVCSERFAKRFLLNRHLRGHGGDKPVATKVMLCEVEGCDEMFFSLEEENEHLEKAHAKGQPSVVAGDKQAAKTSIDEVSPSETPKHHLVCAICSRSFKRQSYLRSHVRTHFEPVDDRKEFACPVPGCDKMYTRKTNMMAHYNAAHDAIKSQRFVCPHEGCEGRFGRKSILKNHISKIHEAKVNPPTPKRLAAKRKAQGVSERALGLSKTIRDDQVVIIESDAELNEAA